MRSDARKRLMEQSDAAIMQQKYLIPGEPGWKETADRIVAKVVGEPDIRTRLTPDFNRLNPKPGIPPVIGLSGYARSGKDAVGSVLSDLYGYQRLSFADNLRHALYRLNPLVAVGVDEVRSLRDLVDSLGWERIKNVSDPEYGPRPLLQRLGTEVGRQMFGENFWVEQTMKTITSQPDEHFVITDVRFPNEGRAVLDQGGFVVRVERPGIEATNGHASETAMDDWKFDYVIENNAGLVDLQARVMEMLGDL